MSRSSKRKLAIVAGISECLIYAEAKYCAFEIHGDPKYYVCPRSEYCCNFGCCVSPGFQIYHLWYYWILVIIMFLVCSGGGWWYRYWLQGRYRAAASAIPSRSVGSSRGPSAMRNPACPAQQASITYNSARNTVLLHRMWKAGGPHRGAGSSPAYPGPPVAAAASSTHFQNTSVVLNDVNCPYYQLYGPPPSYETVIAQTRGKISSPMSPERSRNLDVAAATAAATAAAAATGSSALPNNPEHAPRCYNHSPYNGHPSQPGAIAGIQDSASISRYEQTADGIVDPAHRQIDPHEASTAFASYVPSYGSSSIGATPVHPAARQENCMSLDYHGGPIPPLDYHADAATIVPETFRIYHSSNLERLPSYHGERPFLDPKTRKINGSPLTSCSIREPHSRASLPGVSHASVPDLKTEGERRAEVYGHRARATQDDQRELYARHHGGSLKFSRTRDEAHPAAVTYGSFRRGQTFLEIATGSATSRTELSNGVDDQAASVRGAAVISGNSVILSDAEATSSRSGRIRDDFRVDFGSPGAFSRSTRNGLLSGGSGGSAADACRVSLRRCGIRKQQTAMTTSTTTTTTTTTPTSTTTTTTNPSDNVILEPLNSALNYEADSAAAAAATAVGAGEVDCMHKGGFWSSVRRQEQDEKRRRRVPSPGAATRGTDAEGAAGVANNQRESKHNKLDRSKSLD